jgi:hypothetical protein
MQECSGSETNQANVEEVRHGSRCLRSLATWNQQDNGQLSGSSDTSVIS